MKYDVTKYDVMKYDVMKYDVKKYDKKKKQAGAELGKAQFKLGFDFTLICCKCCFS